MSIEQRTCKVLHRFFELAGHRYKYKHAGKITNGFWPVLDSAAGSAPHTSASPPVFANGATSLVANKIFMRAIVDKTLSIADFQNAF